VNEVQNEEEEVFGKKPNEFGYYGEFSPNNWQVSA